MGASSLYHNLNLDHIKILSFELCCIHFIAPPVISFCLIAWSLSLFTDGTRPCLLFYSPGQALLLSLVSLVSMWTGPPKLLFFFLSNSFYQQMFIECFLCSLYYIMQWFRMVKKKNHASHIHETYCILGDIDIKYKCTT